MFVLSILTCTLLFSQFALLFLLGLMLGLLQDGSQVFLQLARYTPAASGKAGQLDILV